MTSERYTLYRKGYGPRGLLSVLDQAKVSYTTVSEFGRRALTIELTDDEAKKIKAVDENVRLMPYEGLKMGAPDRLSTTMLEEGMRRTGITTAPAVFTFK